MGIQRSNDGTDDDEHIPSIAHSWKDWYEVILTPEEVDCLTRGVTLLLEEAEDDAAWSEAEAARLRDILAKLKRRER
jgi:hypothetical protein